MGRRKKNLNEKKDPNQKKKLTLLLDQDLYEKFRAIADEQRLPMTAVMRRWIMDASDPRQGQQERKEIKCRKD